MTVITEVEDKDLLESAYYTHAQGFREQHDPNNKRSGRYIFKK